MTRRALLALAAALVLAACAGGGSGDGDGTTARLWVTVDRGAELLVDTTVPAGLTVLEALKQEADVETRYGGRYVQAIDGVEGSLASQRDWFYFVNGIEPDLGAGEVVLNDGDVAWWDFRSWEGGSDVQPVVVGAFPEPFVHGWDGRPRPAVVQAPPGLAPEAKSLAGLLDGPGRAGAPNRFVLAVDSGADGATLTASRGPANDSPVTFTLTGSHEAVAAAAAALAADPTLVEQRYEARFDEEGRVAR